MPLRHLAQTRLPLLDDARPVVRRASGLALVAACTAAGLVGVRMLEPLLERTYFFPGFFAVIFPALLAGTRQGLLATAAFSIGYAWLYLDPRGSLAVADARDAVALGAYTLTACVVVAACGGLRAAYGRLRQEHEALDRIYRQREDLMHAMTHDIRSPLNAINMNAALLATRDSGASRRAQMIQQSVANIDSMLRDLVEVVALESGSVALERHEIDLEAMLLRMKERFAGTLPIERVRVAIAREAQLLHADPRRFERVLVNLISNALKYSPGEVSVCAVPRDHEVVVSVSDHGPGIPPDELPHVFDKYFRASAARSQQGLGLGLYISRLLVEAHGGRIWAESQPGRGSTFSVAIPEGRGVVAGSRIAGSPIAASS